jgi:hypothetical protein
MIPIVIIFDVTDYEDFKKLYLKYTLVMVLLALAAIL